MASNGLFKMGDMGWTNAAGLATNALEGAAKSYASMDKAVNRTETMESGGSVFGDILPAIGMGVGAMFGGLPGAALGATIGGSLGSAVGGRSAAGTGAALAGATNAYANWGSSNSSAQNAPVASSSPSNGFSKDWTGSAAQSVELSNDSSDLIARAKSTAYGYPF